MKMNVCCREKAEKNVRWKQGMNNRLFNNEWTGSFQRKCSFVPILSWELVRKRSGSIGKSIFHRKREKCQK
jgi:hypothetical protein